MAKETLTRSVPRCLGLGGGWFARNPGGTLVEPWWNPGGTLVEPIVEPYLRAAPDYPGACLG